MTRVVRLETRVCFRITWLMNNPNEKPKKSYLPKRRESDDKNAVSIAKSVSQVGCVSQDSDALISQGRKSQRSPMQKVLEPIQRVRFKKSTLRQASIREKKGPSLGKYMSKFLISEVPTLWNLRTGPHEETERQQRCARSKAWNLSCQKTFTSSKKQDEAAFYFPAEEWVLPAASTQSRRKESL